MTDGFNILTPLAFGNSKMRYPPCPQNSIIIKPPSPSEFPFFVKPFGIIKGVHKYAQLGLFYVNWFHITPLLCIN